MGAASGTPAASAAAPGPAGTCPPHRAPFFDRSPGICGRRWVDPATGTLYIKCEPQWVTSPCAAAVLPRRPRPRSALRALPVRRPTASPVPPHCPLPRRPRDRRACALLHSASKLRRDPRRAGRERQRRQRRPAGACSAGAAGRPEAAACRCLPLAGRCPHQAPGTRNRRHAPTWGPLFNNSAGVWRGGRQQQPHRVCRLHQHGSRVPPGAGAARQRPADPHPHLCRPQPGRRRQRAVCEPP